jgi:hypothetical protein
MQNNDSNRTKNSLCCGCDGSISAGRTGVINLGRNRNPKSEWRLKVRKSQWVKIALRRLRHSFVIGAWAFVIAPIRQAKQPVPPSIVRLP